MRHDIRRRLHYTTLVKVIETYHIHNILVMQTTKRRLRYMMKYLSMIFIGKSEKKLQL